MNEILKKIDELIDKTNYELYKAGLEDAKDIILSQHKQLATDNNVVTKSGKDNNVLTIGDKMRESNGKIANLLHELADCKKCPVIDGCTANNDYACYGRLFDFLNQPYTE